MPKQFTQVKFLPFLPQGGPASVNRKTGVLTIGLDVWNTLEKDWKIFVLFHELGHYELDSSDEQEVDAWAVDQYIKHGYSPTQAVYAMTRVFSYQSEEQAIRSVEQLKNVLWADWKYNNNNSALDAPIMQQ